MSTVMQKAITPQMSAAYLERGLDRVAGFVLPAAAASAVTTTAALFELHGLGFPGSPFSPDRPIDILHLPVSPTATLLPATGGTDEASRQANGGKFLDRPPFAGTGFATTGDVVAPLSWLEHTRISPGARLWRFDPGAAEPELIGTYHGVAFGWQNHLAADELHALAPSKFVGHVAKLELGAFAADVKTDDDGGPTVVTLVTMSEQAEQHGFTRTKAGTWAKQVVAADVELFEIHAGARWHGIPVRIVDQGPAPDGQQLCRITSLAHDADVAERLLMDKVDAGVYETTAPLADLEDVVYAQRVPKAWAKDGQLSQARAAVPGAAGATAATGAAATVGVGGAAATAGVAGTGTGTDATARPQTAARGPASKHSATLQLIAQGLARVAPTGWTRVRVLCRMVGSRGEILAAATNPEGKELMLPGLPEDVTAAMSQLRHAGYEQGRGTWYTAMVTLVPDGTLTLNVDYTNEPRWSGQSGPLDPVEFAEDAKRYPRDAEHTPEWLRARLAEAGAAE
ncbi:hypothetical protein [Georgenia yuyongxinii]|uniref:Uncharacterized protein n=1 Tax=Georgenia yuyongxinii TaxID=2589797 RepID=A0A552WTG4_9MICO|nr:hypothetical protein [Georgenia yuyongxinii]TRW45985.1 hypothetical protein FJ693_07465 [Georgenia yuyongxinii]